ncbi:MAG: RNA polymerase sigma factor [Flavobacteriaceae bacterium]
MEVDRDTILFHITEAKSGKQSAFNFLLDTFWKEVYGFQLKRTQNEIEAEDITIQTFSKAFHKIDLFDESYKFSTWLITISKNIHYDYLRKNKSSITGKTTNEDRDYMHHIVDDTPTIEDKIITEQNLAQLLKDVKKLKPHYQEVIQLRYFQEMSYKEIAQVINEPMSNVKVKLLRARKLLAEIIAKNK